MAALNTGFETGDFTDWNPIGNATIQTVEFGSNPTEGVFQALITNGGGSVSDAQLESILGLKTGALDSLGNGNATEGSALQLTPITVKAGSILSFDWNFLTSELTPSSFNDFGFVSISSLPVSELADTNSNFPFSNPPFSSATGYGKFTYQFDTAGTFTVSLGIVDEGDSSVASALLVDNLQLIIPIEGTADDDSLIGTDGIDIISGLEGDDSLLGLGSDDQIFGGSGDDLILAGAGNDTAEGGTGEDEISGNSGNDTLEGNDGLDVIFGGDGDDLISGGNGKDRIYGEDGNDQINGDNGNDNINSGAGDDLVSGGSGKDRIFGGAGADQLSGNSGNDNLNGDTGVDIIDGGDGNDFLFGGTDNDTLNGGADQDNLRGGAGNDALDGGSGNDQLTGVDPRNALFGFGVGEIDTLTGGLGIDTFALGDATRVYYDDGTSFTTGELDYALVTDFNASEDIIQLNGSADFYSLDFFTSSLGTTDAAIIYDPGVAARGEVIGILQNVSTSISITDSAFTFV